jgi:hypothetical protein
VTHHLLGGICLVVLVICWIVGACLSFHVRGYKFGRNEGYREGYMYGYRDGCEVGQMPDKPRADEWWADAEKEVTRTRETIRREEA